MTDKVIEDNVAALLLQMEVKTLTRHQALAVSAQLFAWNACNVLPPHLVPDFEKHFQELFNNTFSEGTGYRLTLTQ